MGSLAVTGTVGDRRRVHLGCTCGARPPGRSCRASQLGKCHDPGRRPIAVSGHRRTRSSPRRSQRDHAPRDLPPRAAPWRALPVRDLEPDRGLVGHRRDRRASDDYRGFLGADRILTPAPTSKSHRHAQGAASPWCRFSSKAAPWPIGEPECSPTPSARTRTVNPAALEARTSSHRSRQPRR